MTVSHCERRDGMSYQAYRIFLRGVHGHDDDDDIVEGDGCGDKSEVDIGLWGSVFQCFCQKLLNSSVFLENHLEVDV